MLPINISLIDFEYVVKELRLRRRKKAFKGIRLRRRVTKIEFVKFNGQRQTFHEDERREIVDS